MGWVEIVDCRWTVEGEMGLEAAHQCDESMEVSGGDEIEVEYWDDSGWRLVLSDETYCSVISCKIKFCPFCGLKLEDL